MNKIDRERQKGLEALQHTTKQSFAFLKMDKDGKCQECYSVGLHKDTDLALFEQQAIAYKAEKEALEAKEKLEREKVLEKDKQALQARFERVYALSAYNLLINDYQMGIVECENIEELSKWFKLYLMGKAELTTDSLFNEYLSLAKGGK